MELLFTKRYKLNLAFSIILSLLMAVTAAAIITKLPDGKYLAYDLKGLAGASVFILSYLYFTRKYRRRRRVLLTEFPLEWIEILEKHVPFYSLLNERDKYVFQKKIQLFLSGVRLTGIGMEIDDLTRVLIGAGAAIPVFKVPEWEYTLISDIFICPDKFNDYFPLVSRENEIYGMVVHNSSAVYLSRESLLRGFSKTDGNNTCIHEFMHKIDEGSGDIDGMLPAPFLSGKERSEWRNIVDEEMKRLEKGNSLLRPYALTSRAEFIAVAAEFFFERPRELKQIHPGLYRIMERMFRQNLSAAAGSEARSMFKRIKFSRTDNRNQPSWKN